MPLTDVLRELGLSFSAPCGGNGRCGKCRAVLTDSRGRREILLCRTLLEEDCLLELPEAAEDISWNRSEAAAAAAPGRSGLGAALDLGTTTLALRLYDLADGRLLGEKSVWNAQRSCGADVISRIQYARDDAGGLEYLTRTVRDQARELTGALCEAAGRSLSEVRELFFCGNTVMEHLFAGLSPESIGVVPYRPLSFFDRGESLPLSFAPALPAPCVSGYVGGDITCGLLGSGLYDLPGKNLFIDVGTNGEMALGGRDGFVSCAVACGPAFEGACIECGMPAKKGAISAARLEEGKLCLTVLGGGEPEGICGSGLLDLCACLLELKLIDRRGRLTAEGGRFPLSEDGSVYLSKKDVRALQTAKAAVAAGIRRLLETEGAALSDLCGLYLAGGFGNRLDPASAAAIGMLPKELLSRTRGVGNAALAGASQALLQPDKRQELLRIKEKCRYLELSADKRFPELFVEELGF